MMRSTGLPREPSPQSRTRDNAVHAGLSPPLVPLRELCSSPPVSSNPSLSNNSLIAQEAMETWDGQDLPSEEVFEAFYFDMKLLIEEKREGKLSTQMNYTKNGFKSIIKKLKEEKKDIEYVVRIKSVNNQKHNQKHNQIQNHNQKHNQIQKHNQKQKQKQKQIHNQIHNQKQKQIQNPNKLKVRIIPITNIRNSSHPFTYPRPLTPYHQPESIGAILRMVQSKVRII